MFQAPWLSIRLAAAALLICGPASAGEAQAVPIFGGVGIFLMTGLIALIGAWRSKNKK